MTTTVQPPHWDMSVVYPGLGSTEFIDDFQRLLAELDDLAVFFDTNDIREAENLPVDPQTVELFDEVLRRLDQLLDSWMTMSAYISSFVSTDAADTVAQARMSELQKYGVKLSQLDTRFTAWIGGLDVEALIKASPLAADHAFMLRKTKEQAEHQMSSAEEDLATELGLTGGTAWGKLYGDLTAQMMVPWEDGEVPMTVIRNFAYNPDGDIRRRAYEAELAAWRGVKVPLAAALNSIKGETNTLTSHRRWETALDMAVFQTNIDRQTLDAMMQAARESFPDFRRYLNAKARALGEEKLPWYDLFAPVGKSSREWEWDEARDFLIEQFRTYSDRMSDFVARAFRENWIDAEPRPGKRGGAFCMPLRRDESRVLSNFTPSYNAMSTLAHELGHAYHNFNMDGRTRLQRRTPMTLAETASIFCETIIRGAALAQSDEQEQLSILESTLQGACQVVVDISSRFIFEKTVFERRHERELSIEELDEIMLNAQRETYGDGLDPNALHPYMWEAKGHYYSSGRPFYNYPYMFGQLFGTGLYARYTQDPETFKAGYDDLLSSTGLADAATLAARFGIDIRSVDFWRSSLDIIRQDIDRFESLVGSSRS